MTQTDRQTHRLPPINISLAYGRKNCTVVLQRHWRYFLLEVAHIHSHTYSVTDNGIQSKRPRVKTSPVSISQNVPGSKRPQVKTSPSFHFPRPKLFVCECVCVCVTLYPYFLLFLTSQYSNVTAYPPQVPKIRLCGSHGSANTSAN